MVAVPHLSGGGFLPTAFEAHLADRCRRSAPLFLRRSCTTPDHWCPVLMFQRSVIESPVRQHHAHRTSWRGDVWVKSADLHVAITRAE